MHHAAFGSLRQACLAAVLVSLCAPLAAQDVSTFTLPDKSEELQAGLQRVLELPSYRKLVQQGRLSVALVDLSDPHSIRYAGLDDDRERYAASLPKIGILLGVFDQVDKGRVRYTPQLKTKLEQMIRRSDNAKASEMIRLVGFPTIAAALRDPRYALYDPERGGGIWVGRGYGGKLGLWRRDPIGHQSHGATARQTARFLVMMDQGALVSPWASEEMKDILSRPAIHHKFVRGLDARPNSVIYRKSGTWKQWHADAALVERDGKKYVAVALLDSPNSAGGTVLSNLIVRLDDLIFQSPAVVPTAVAR
ncbi:MAG TPA: serine hydrolase [Longimicrobiales bacterium]|nr:serine hydrolase [Longimicrobiales bacterium]